MAVGPRELENRFGFHRATIEGQDATAPKHAELRVAFMAFAMMLDECLNDSREKNLSLTELENSSMWAHKAIAKTAPLTGD